MGPGSFVPVGATELGCAGLASPLPRSHVPKLFVPGLPINCSCQAWPPGQRPGPLSRCAGGHWGPGAGGDSGCLWVPGGSCPCPAARPPALSPGVLYPSCHPCLAPGPCLLGGHLCPGVFVEGAWHSSSTPSTLCPTCPHVCSLVSCTAGCGGTHCTSRSSRSWSGGPRQIHCTDPNGRSPHAPRNRGGLGGDKASLQRSSTG